MKQRINYSQLFKELYTFYKEEGDNDRTWSKIFSKLKKVGYIDCVFHQSKIHYCLYSDSYSYILSVIPTAFRTYNPDKNASLFTYVTLLLRQAIWRYIRDTTEADKIFNVSNNKFSEYEENNFVESVDNEYVKKESSANASELIRHITNICLRNDIYREVYYCKKGILGYLQLTSNTQVAEYLNLSLKTVLQAAEDNKRRMTLAKKFISEKGIEQLNKENFVEFIKTSKK